MNRPSKIVAVLSGSLTLLLLGPSVGVAAPNPSAVPQRFSVFIGGFMGESFQLQLKDGALIYTVLSRAQSSEKRSLIRPTLEQWREFRQTLDRLRVWKWRPDYPNAGVMDGTQWSLEIAFEDRAIQTRGSNNYPACGGQPADQLEPTGCFKEYLDAIKKLIGDKPFA